MASPSKKPSHLQKRFRTRSNKSVESTTKKAKDILDNRRQKLALRSDAIKAKLKSIKESRVLETENQMKKITIGLEEATTKREELLKVKVESNASIVERAKTIARTQNQKSREEMAVIQKNLEKRMRTTSNRRARNLLVPKSRLLDAKTRRESLVVNDEAAVCIQDWWRERKFTPLVKIYRKVAVTKLKAKELNFSGLMARVQNPTTLKATSFLIIRAKRTVGIKYNWKQPARVLLLAYVIALYPQEMFTEMNVQEQDLISLAAQCITELEHYVNATSPEVIAPLARSFLPVFADFYTAFEAWKKKDSKKVISELVDHFMELDQLWISVCENENAMLEWGPNIDQHQKMHLTRLKRYGDGAVQLLLDARQQLKASFEEAGTELKIARNVVPTASATVYYVTSNRDSVKRIDSVLDGTEIVNEQVQKPTAQDMDMFGQLLSNEQLAHEIAMDPSFKLQPAAKSELQQRVEKQAKQAFADALDREIDVQVYDKKCLVIIKDISQV